MYDVTTSERRLTSGPVDDRPYRRGTADVAGVEGHASVRADDDDHAAPGWCLAAHFFDDDDPVHLEVSNSGFEDEVRRRVETARATGEYGRLLDPRAACPWVNSPAGDASESASASDGDGGTTSEEAFRRLADGTFVFPSPSMALETLDVDERAAETAAEGLRERRREREGLTVRGDVV